MLNFMHSRMLQPTPPPVAGEQAREDEEFPDTVTILEQDAEGYSVSEEIEKNLPCRLAPIGSTSTVDAFDTGREYTDRIILQDFNGRVNGGHYALVTIRRNAGHYEQILFAVNDIEHSGNGKRTTLLARKQGLDTG